MPNPRPFRSLFVASVVALTLVACGQPTEPGPAAARGPASAAREEPETPIRVCGAVITQPGRYRLTRDLVECPGVGVAIRSSKVLLRLNGHAVRGTPGAVAGILVGVAPPLHRTLSRVRIEGPGTVEGFGVGVSFTGVSYSRLTGVTARLNGDGLLLTLDSVNGERLTSNYDTLIGNTFSENTRNGVWVAGAYSTVFIDNRVERNGNGSALFGGCCSTLRRNRILANTGVGLSINEFNYPNTFVGNTVLNNGGGDIVDYNSPSNCLWPDGENILGSYHCYGD